MDNLFKPDEPKVPGFDNPLIDNLINPDNKFDTDTLKPDGGNSNNDDNDQNGNELPNIIDWYEP